MSARAVTIDGHAFTEHELTCPDCGAPMRLVWIPRDRAPWYGCSQWPECKGAHGARWDGRPLGVPADAATRAARREAHRAFDPLWELGRMDRTAAYAWLAARMGLPPERAHISQFTIAQCKRVVALCGRLAAALLAGRRR